VGQSGQGQHRLRRVTETDPVVLGRPRGRHQLRRCGADLQGECHRYREPPREHPSQAEHRPEGSQRGLRRRHLLRGRQRLGGPRRYDELGARQVQLQGSRWVERPSKWLERRGAGGDHSQWRHRLHDRQGLVPDRRQGNGYHPRPGYGQHQRRGKQLGAGWQGLFHRGPYDLTGAEEPELSHQVLHLVYDWSRDGDPIAIAIAPRQWTIVTIAELQNSGLVCLGLNGTWAWDKIGLPF